MPNYPRFTAAGLPVTIRIALNHRIARTFDRHVRLSTHWLRLRPAPHTVAPISAYSLRIDTEPHFLNWVRDPYENYIARVDFPEPVNRTVIDVELLLELAPVNPFEFLVDPEAKMYPVDYSDQLRKELAPYLRASSATPQMENWLKGFSRRSQPIVESLSEINAKIYEAFPTTSSGCAGPVDCITVLSKRQASPWELAWLATLTFRSLGLAARFTSGYKIVTANNDQQNDFAMLHGWTELFLPGAGWIGLDPAAGVFTNETYVPLSSAPEPLRALPFSGYRDACDELIHEEILVRRLSTQNKIDSNPRSDISDIRTVGNRVDKQLSQADIHLATAVELTFVSTINSTSPEWTTHALGAEKLRIAEQLCDRMALRLASGTVLHQSQGAWIGGEPLPRWRLNCIFRRDGEPLWTGNSITRRLGLDERKCSHADARNFAQALVDALGISRDYLISTFEDALFDLSNNVCHVNFQPSATELADPDQRNALASRLSSTAADPAGYALPLRWNYVSESWTSGQWQFRRSGMFLTPGDSAMGFRLPLDSLPTSSDEQNEPHLERSPFEDRPASPTIHGETSARHSEFTSRPQAPTYADIKDAHPTPKTALCVEMRNGQLHAFIPPLTHLEHYLSLVAVINRVATSLSISVALEGYAPPTDFRVIQFTVEPDCGVLRVRLPKTESSAQQMDWIETCYEEATALGLASTRTLSDGSVVPAGGDISLILGSDRPSESPFLLKPSLLRSLITYWQRHPSLSYFFARQEIGPSGAAARPDEGRDDALYELTIALDRIPSGDCAHPWISDRLLRHLLADPAGDIKKAEVCIDELYSPSNQEKRLGQIALRCFDMRETPTSAAAQTLLVKGLLVLFSQSPTSNQLIDWGPALHDRFMLPRMLWQDLSEVLRDLNNIGLPFQDHWYSPILEQTLPLIGDVQIGDITLELRTAREPWPLLAEEVVAGRTVRFIDSAIQRVQVRVSGLTPDRYVLTCNQRFVPLQSTSIRGENIAGIRFKAWNPSSTRHPTRSPARSLLFTLVDTWKNRVAGGITYIPKRPDVRGVADVAPSTTAAVWPQPPANRESPAVNTAPWAAPGRIAAIEGGQTPPMIPNKSCDSNLPYLLDLV